MTARTTPLDEIVRAHRAGEHAGITSVCSAHPWVIRAAARHAARGGTPLLIEATCNQVNQHGGYTGLRPYDFVARVRDIATREALAPERLVFGGDHLGPNPWRDRDAEEAMAEAVDLVDAYVRAGFRKLHLDTSMGCAGEPAALDDEITAARACRLVEVAERVAAETDGPMPRYVIGTEVPPPGGADHVLERVTPTSAAATRRTIEVHREAFEARGLSDAFGRVLALVVQPGVEFGNANVRRYDPAGAGALSEVLDEHPGLVYEAHSTDYQGPEPLRRLVEDGFAILKVGPELTFVMREALYGLDLIATELVDGHGNRPLFGTMESLMVERPEHWRRHYAGTEAERRLLRHYSYSDRIRYYWNEPEARAALERLLAGLRGRIVPAPLFRQHLPRAEHLADRPLDPVEPVLEAIERTLDDYRFGCAGPPAWRASGPGAAVVA